MRKKRTTIWAKQSARKVFPFWYRGKSVWTSSTDRRLQIARFDSRGCQRLRLRYS